jgi:Holliday junction DNA helicase RuvA
MMTKMTGVLTRVLQEEEVRLQVGPFEYQVLVPETARRQLQLRTGQEVTFHVTEFLEGNGGGNRFVPRRIGFLTEAELEFFELLCTVDKIGVKKALRAMNRPVKEIAEAIARQDSRWLGSLPGIGAATAEQVIISLKRKVTRFALMAAPQPTLPDATAAPAPDAVVEANGKANGKAATRRRKPAGEPEPEPATEPLVTPADGQLIEDVYQALMGLGHNPIEARTKLDGLLTCGKPFKNLQDALTLIYAQKG